MTLPSVTDGARLPFRRQPEFSPLASRDLRGKLSPNSRSTHPTVNNRDKCYLENWTFSCLQRGEVSAEVCRNGQHTVETTVVVVNILNWGNTWEVFDKTGIWVLASSFYTLNEMRGYGYHNDRFSYVQTIQWHGHGASQTVIIEKINLH